MLKRLTQFAVLLALVACGAELPVDLGAGPTKDEVCERFLADARASTEVTVEHPGDPADDVPVPSAAEQYLETAEGLAELGRFASDADDPEVAGRGERLERHARAVLADLSPRADDDEAHRIVEPMFTESIGLYYDCAAHILEQAPPEAPTARAAGACERPGAPTLDGPNVVHYGSGGQDFIESTCELREGVRVDDGCSFPGHGTTLSDEDGHQAHASVEVAYDPDTCRALYETGPVEPGSPP